MPFGIMSDNSLAQQPLTLLVVAPDQEIRNLVKAVLAAGNNRILLADNENDGFALVKAERPDVILATSGIHETGPALCARVRRDPLTAKTPFVMLTTSRNRRTFVDYFALGCDQILPVPFKCKDIYTAICQARKRNRDNQAKIQVLLQSGLADFIEPLELNRLLAKQEVLCFRRSNGIAMVGRDPIRCGRRADYSGLERRLAKV